MERAKIYITVEERPLLTVERERECCPRRVALLTLEEDCLVEVSVDDLAATAARLGTQAYALDSYLNPVVLQRYAEEQRCHLDPVAFQVVRSEWASIHECGHGKRLG